MSKKKAMFFSKKISLVQDYIDAHGSLTTTQKDAVNVFANTLNDAGIWESVIAIYPIIGNNNAKTGKNLKDPTKYNANTWSSIVYDNYWYIAGATGNISYGNVLADEQWDFDDHTLFSSQKYITGINHNPFSAYDLGALPNPNIFRMQKKKICKNMVFKWN